MSDVRRRGVVVRESAEGFPCLTDREFAAMAANLFRSPRKMAPESFRALLGIWLCPQCLANEPRPAEILPSGAHGPIRYGRCGDCLGNRLPDVFWSVERGGAFDEPGLRQYSVWTGNTIIRVRARNHRAAANLFRAVHRRAPDAVETGLEVVDVIALCESCEHDQRDARESVILDGDDYASSPEGHYLCSRCLESD